MQKENPKKTLSKLCIGKEPVLILLLGGINVLAKFILEKSFSK